MHRFLLAVGRRDTIPVLWRFGVVGLLHVSVHFLAVVYFTLKLVHAIEPPLWLDAIIYILNVAGLTRTVFLLRPLRRAGSRS